MRNVPITSASSVRLNLVPFGSAETRQAIPGSERVDYCGVERVPGLARRR